MWSVPAAVCEAVPMEAPAPWIVVGPVAPASGIADTTHPLVCAADPVNTMDTAVDPLSVWIRSLSPMEWRVEDPFAHSAVLHPAVTAEMVRAEVALVEMPATIR
jgi:hypothetical protein